MPTLKITTIYDNHEHDPGLRIGWDFSCLVESDKGTPFYQLHTDWVDVLEVLAATQSPRAKGAPPRAMAE